MDIFEGIILSTTGAKSIISKGGLDSGWTQLHWSQGLGWGEGVLKAWSPERHSLAGGLRQVLSLENLWAEMLGQSTEQEKNFF